MDRAPGRRRTLALAVAAFVAVAAIVGLIVFYPADWPGFAPPSPVTVQGHDTEGIYRFVFTIAAVIFLLVEGLILFAVLRYRRTDDTPAGPDAWQPLGRGSLDDRAGHHRHHPLLRLDRRPEQGRGPLCRTPT